MDREKMVDGAVFKIYTVTMGKKPLDMLKTGLHKLQGQIQERKDCLLATRLEET